MLLLKMPILNQNTMYIN